LHARVQTTLTPSRIWTEISLHLERAHGRDALFLYLTENSPAHGEGTSEKINDSHEDRDPELSPVRKWATTARWHSPAFWEIARSPADIVSASWVAFAGRGVTELAVEGVIRDRITDALDQAPVRIAGGAAQSGLGRWSRSRPRTPSGAALFLYSGGSMARNLPTGTLTQRRSVTYLSAGRPGLMADGTTAVLAGCARITRDFFSAERRPTPGFAD